MPFQQKSITHEHAMQQAETGGAWLQPAPALRPFDPVISDPGLEDHVKPPRPTSTRRMVWIASVILAALCFVILSDLLMSLAAAAITSSKWRPNEGLINARRPSTTPGRPKLLLGVDVDYPPYAYIRQAPFDAAEALDEVVGVGVDMIRGMAKHCNFDVDVIQVHWNDCWGDGEIGAGLREGWYHGCMTSRGVFSRPCPRTRDALSRCASASFQAATDRHVHSCAAGTRTPPPCAIAISILPTRGPSGTSRPA